jgi:DNA-directed RNA polymerase alpha subunit
MEKVVVEPIPMLLWCPECKTRHIDDGIFATKSHHTHACQNCGHVWRPAIVPTVGVKFLPGFKNETAASITAANQEALVKNLWKSIDELEVSVRSAGALQHAGYKYIGDVVKKHEGELLDLKRFGKRVIKDIKEALSYFDLSLGMDIDANVWPGTCVPSRAP